MQIRPSKNRCFTDWWGKKEEKKANAINRVKYFCTCFKACPVITLCCVSSAEAGPRGQAPPRRSIRTHREPTFNPKDGEETGALGFFHPGGFLESLTFQKHHPRLPQMPGSLGAPRLENSRFHITCPFAWGWKHVSALQDQGKQEA